MTELQHTMSGEHAPESAQGPNYDVWGNGDGQPIPLS